MSLTYDNDGDALSTALHVITTERDALTHLECLYRTNDLAQKNVERAVSQLVHTINRGGKLVVCGVGKSGKIGRKLEATMNSVGIHSVFLHPTEALHGDLGVIRSIDTLLLISFSGRTAELLLMLPHIPPTVPIIAITSHTHPSTCPLLSFNSPDMTILLPAPLHIDEESSFGLSAPTSSTTVALALGDALALAAAHKLHTLPGQGPAEVFKGYHPGGAIGAAAATAAAINSAISTPSTSMTTSPSLRSLEDAGIKLSLDDSITHTGLKSDTTICSSEHFVSMECIPTVSPSQQQQQTEKKDSIRVIDVLLTAIQNPNSKSWVKLSDTQIIPPRLLRAMTDPSTTTFKIDTPITEISSATFPSTSIHASRWLPIRSSTTIEKVKCILEETTGITDMMLSDNQKQNNEDAENKYIVISVVDDMDSNKILGFVAGEDVHPSILSSAS
ncbi:sugar isomerase, KpsF/GutQ [Talaromyces stipitatus ATCC 10500]|uniref:Sugar isomerase, KpsF/GutQ n=1 Tax=Talaromyces stipitatus (strain ATCC 10500 / CBS 375.48 / QM 6759 / NRRL 1006) TaxID=441959 RepID=B8M314_TALSN|nr:sugar isomerase, KpsF/GutQ [Talaromyces stipitatus ATCC 10500]EED21990.1 sugar isomerase, KpsF/GutQ [Talaromyces stipitatus ATCC 10500]